MSSRVRSIAVVATALLLAAACTSGGDSEPAASPSSTAAGLAAEWAPKLKTVAAADTGICNQAGDQACAEHLTDIALALTGLEQAVTAAGGKGVYPRTVAEIDKANAAVEAYTDHECLGDVNAGIQGSPCPDDARVVMSAPATLQLSLEADEARG
jgi:hypothetical protein